MKIVVAPDKFKNSLTAKEAAGAIGRGLSKVLPESIIDLVPLADGGEGTVDTLLAATNGQARTTKVTGPLGEPVEAGWGIGNDVDGTKTAFIEMSAASGLKLVPGKKSALDATTFGTGELVVAALDAGCGRIILGIGGSATTDGGAGAAEALGVKLLDSRGRRLDRGGGTLSELAVIETNDLDPRLFETEVLVASDVDNLLCGPNGAAGVYGPQKGATATEIAQLDTGLRRLAAAIKNDLGFDVSDTPGAGAAGGLGAGMIAFAGANLVPGFDLVSRMVRLRERLDGADLAITGEGQIDLQTARGKVPTGVARLARQQAVPTVAIAGTIGPGAESVYEHGIAAIEPICVRPMAFAEAMENAAILVEAAAERLLRMVLVGPLSAQEQRGDLGPT